MTDDDGENLYGRNREGELIKIRCEKGYTVRLNQGLDVTVMSTDGQVRTIHKNEPIFESTDLGELTEEQLRSVEITILPRKHQVEFKYGNHYDSLSLKTRESGGKKKK